MSTNLAEEALADFTKTQALANAPALFATASFYTSGAKGKFTLPSVGFEMKECAPLHAGTNVSQGTLTIWVETQAQDENEATHDARCQALRGFLQNAPTVAAAITAAGKVRLFGFAAGSTSRELKDNHWTSGFDYAVGFVPLPPPPANAP